MRPLRALTETGRIFRCAAVIAFALFAPFVYAKATIVTLPELIRQSQLIVYGHVDAAAKTRSLAPASSVRFEASRILKGESSVDGSVVLLCDSRPNSEWPDLSKLAGNNILFLTRDGECFRLSHSYRSLVRIHGNDVSTVTIEDQPEQQPLDQFIEKVRAYASEHARVVR
jgi:hypothetical protein